MYIRTQLDITSNQNPERKNHLSRFIRKIASLGPLIGVMPRPTRPMGISVFMRIKDEKDWINASIQSIKDIADEIVIVDNGSTDGTYQMLEEMAHLEKDLIKLWQQPDLDHCALSNFALDQTRFRWVFRWDGDMVAHTSRKYSISHLRHRVLALDPRRYYLIHLRHINLSGDLFHQDPSEQVHIEEYIHTYSQRAHYVHPGRFEAIKVPKYYRVLFWYEPYSFHVNVKPASRMLLRYFWDDWMELKDYQKFPTIKDYVNDKIEEAFGTKSWEDAQRICIRRVCSNYIHYDQEVFGPYPDLLKPYLENPRYRLRYKEGKIVGRDGG
jgi:glycosyltransferase involved in cell wall biosynthesis